MAAARDPPRRPPLPAAALRTPPAGPRPRRACALGRRREGAGPAPSRRQDCSSQSSRRQGPSRLPSRDNGPSRCEPIPSPEIARGGARRKRGGGVGWGEPPARRPAPRGTAAGKTTAPGARRDARGPSPRSSREGGDAPAPRQCMPGCRGRGSARDGRGGAVSVSGAGHGRGGAAAARGGARGLARRGAPEDPRRERGVAAAGAAGRRHAGAAGGGGDADRRRRLLAGEDPGGDVGRVGPGGGARHQVLGERPVPQNMAGPAEGGLPVSPRFFQKYLVTCMDVACSHVWYVQSSLLARKWCPARTYCQPFFSRAVTSGNPANSRETCRTNFSLSLCTLFLRVEDGIIWQAPYPKPYYF